MSISKLNLHSQSQKKILFFYNHISLGDIDTPRIDKAKSMKLSVYHHRWDHLNRIKYRIPK